MNTNVPLPGSTVSGRWTPAPFRGLGAAYRAECKRLLSFAIRFLPHHEAEDAVQDAMMTCLDKLRSGTMSGEPGQFEAALFRRVVDTSRMRRRQLARRMPFEKLFIPPREALVRLTETSLDAESDELRQHVNRILGAMPRRWAQVFLLNHDHGLSYAAIAPLMRITEGAARSYFSKACARLRRELAGVGLEPEGWEADE